MIPWANLFVSLGHMLTWEMRSWTHDPERLYGRCDDVFGARSFSGPGMGPSLPLRKDLLPQLWGPWSATQASVVMTTAWPLCPRMSPLGGRGCDVGFLKPTLALLCQLCAGWGEVTCTRYDLGLRSPHLAYQYPQSGLDVQGG